VATIGRMEVVDAIERRTEPVGVPAPRIDVHFMSRRMACLDPADATTPRLLELLGEQPSGPLHVEVDEDSNLITRVRVPLIVKVLAVTRTNGGDLDVRVQPSAARHSVSAGHPQFDSLRTSLEAARGRDRFVMIVRTSNRHEIIHVEDTEDRPFEGQAPLLEPVIGPAVIGPETTEVTEENANELFRFVAAAGCNPDGFVDACIPFLYPDDGCHARAHRMCELLLRERQVHAAKVWLFGELRTRTRNHPDCAVRWIYHVAPVLRVRRNGGVAPHVFDPSLFDSHVPVDLWKGRQGDPHARVRFSTSAIWDQPPDGLVVRDSQFLRTPADLRLYRRLLQARIAAKHGPPPYCE
jgi:glutaminase-like protein